MLDTFLKQTIAVLVIAIFAALMISFITVSVFIVRPQINQAADVAAHTLRAINLSFGVLDESQRGQLIDRLSNNVDLNILASTLPPDIREQPRPFLSRYFKQALEARYKLPDGASVAAGSDGRLWVRINVAQRPLWLSVETAPDTDPLQNLVFVAALAFAAALLAGITLQRRVTRPLKSLEEHVRRFDDPKGHTPLPKVGVREFAAVAEAFNQMAERLRLTEVDRAVMLAGVSHDLRTPLTKLRLSLDMLHDSDTELIDSAKRQVDRIETMLVQFLEYARGFEAEEPRTIRLSALLMSAVNSVDLADKVDVSVPEDHVVSVRQGALIRGLGNLLTNAMRYGAPPYLISARYVDENLVLDVRDCGPGLDQEEARALTRPFARGNSARSDDGTGLGLAIVEQAAQAHGGTLEFAKLPIGLSASLHLPADRLSGSTA